MNLNFDERKGYSSSKFKRTQSEPECEAFKLVLKWVSRISYLVYHSIHFHIAFELKLIWIKQFHLTILHLIRVQHVKNCHMNQLNLQLHKELLELTKSNRKRSECPNVNIEHSHAINIILYTWTMNMKHP